MFTLALGSLGAIQAGSWDPVMSDAPISLQCLPQLIPSQIFLCNILIRNLKSGIELLWLERETRPSLQGGESYDFNVSLLRGLRSDNVEL